MWRDRLQIGFWLLVFIVVFAGIVWSALSNEADYEPRYFKDENTGLCFAAVGAASGRSISQVPCSNEVMAIINNGE